MQPRKKIVIIGGSAAGPKAAAKAKRVDGSAEVIILQKDPDLSMASCGYPYYIGGYFNDRNQLLCTPTGVVRDSVFYLNDKNIDARTLTEVVAIDREEKKLKINNLSSGAEEFLSYDKLIIATGSTPILPPIKGIDLSGVTTLQSMHDADYLRTLRDSKTVRHAVIVGGGLIGIETCEAFHLAGIQMTIVERLPQILTFLDEDLVPLVEKHIRSKGVTIITSNGVSEILGTDGKVVGVKLSDSTEIPCDLVVLSTGVRPNSNLAKSAGLEIGKLGGISVNEFMQTSDPDIYAVGDCIETVNRLTGEKTLAPFGDLANLQGRVAGENAASGNCMTFPGTMQTSICKVFDYTAGSTGLSEKAAKHAGYTNILSVINAGPDKPIFLDGKFLATKLVVESKTGRILGAQCVGLGDVSKQISQWAVAIIGNLTVDDMSNADLPYAPPFALAIDHSVATAHLMQNKLKGRLKGISCREVYEKIANNEAGLILDVRSQDEFKSVSIGVGEKLVPLGELRKRLHELPDDKDHEIICYCKISLRGYEAALVIEKNGWTNVKVMEGGISAWPYQLSECLVTDESPLV